MHSLEIIIVNWNTKQLLDNCLKSVYENCDSTRYQYSVTVVDNASVDDSVQMVKEKYPKVNLIVNKENLGFAKANNIAIRKSKASYVLLLNSDTIVDYDIVTPAINHLEKYDDVALAGCKLILQNGFRQVGDSGYKPSISTAFNFSFLLSKIFPDLFHGLFHNGKTCRSYENVDWVSGAALFARMSFIRECGPLPEDYFMYAEDVKWGLIAKEKGWKVHYLPSITVTHLMGASSSEGHVSTSSLVSLNELIKEDNGYIKVTIFWLIMMMGYFFRNVLSIISTLFIKKKKRQFSYSVYAYKCLSLAIKHR